MYAVSNQRIKNISQDKKEEEFDGDLPRSDKSNGTTSHGLRPHGQSSGNYEALPQPG